MPDFKGNNNLGARALWAYRNIYNGAIISEMDGISKPRFETLQIKDFLKDEKLLYGRVNQQFDPVFPAANYMTTVDGKPILNFVSDAFMDMKKKFDKALREGYINTDGPIGNLKIVKGYSDPQKEYKNYLLILKKEFKNFIKKKNRLYNLTDFESMLPLFMEFMDLISKSMPVSKSAFYISKYMHPTTSGLMIELYAGDYGDDKQKVDLFYKQRNFKYLKNLAYAHGFVIDKHIPWRLVADINSPAMNKYISKRINVNNPNTITIFNRIYKETYPDDIPTFINLMVEMYNQIVDYRRVTAVRVSSKTIGRNGNSDFSNCKTVKTIYRNKVTLKEVVDKYPTGYWIELYTKIRNSETGLKFDDNSLSQIIRNATDLARSLDRPSALGYVIDKFNSVSHYEGSLYYDYTRIKERENTDKTDIQISDNVRRSTQASKFFIY